MRDASSESEVEADHFLRGHLDPHGPGGPENRTRNHEDRAHHVHPRAGRACNVIVAVPSIVEELWLASAASSLMPGDRTSRR